MDEDEEEMWTVCPTCYGEGHIHVPTLAILNGQAQTVLAPRACRQCRDSAQPGWLPGFVPPA